MAQTPSKETMTSPGDREWPAKMVSNKWGEPMALFAVPLPSACKSSFLCLCKRLFWNVGTSYFSAFCPLTAEESTLLPHSSAVVQLVSVTPALATGENKKMSQDLLAYTLWGDIVGIPYVSISQRRQQRGKMSKEFPFDDLLSSAWVPAVNAPFVGATTGNRAVGGRPLKDIFIISNDEQTRQSLLKGKNIVFSQQDGQNCAAVEKDPVPVAVHPHQSLTSGNIAQSEKVSTEQLDEPCKTSTTTKGRDETPKMLPSTNERHQTGEEAPTKKDRPPTPKKLTTTRTCDQTTKVPLTLKDTNKLTEMSETSSTSKDIDQVTKMASFGKDRDQTSKMMAPTSSSLYKLYKRCPENGASSHGMGDIKPPPPQGASESTDEHPQVPEMVLPRIESVFSLADASVHVGSISKQLFDSLSQKSALQKQPPPNSLNTSKNESVHGEKGNSVSVCSTNGGPPGVTYQKASDKPKERDIQQDVKYDMPKKSMEAKPAPVPLLTPKLENQQDKEIQPDKRRERPTKSMVIRPPVVPLLAPKRDPALQSVGSLNVDSVDGTVGGLTVKTTNVPANRCRKKNGFTVKELLQHCGRMSVHPTKAPLHQVKEMVPIHTIHVPVESTENAKCIGNHTSLSTDQSQGDTSRIPSKEIQLNKLSPLKMVIKTKTGSAEVAGTPRPPSNETLVVLGGRVPRLRLHKLDISKYRFVNSAAIPDACSQPPQYVENECMKDAKAVYGDEAFTNSDHKTVSEGSERSTPTLVAPEKRKRKKRKRRFSRPSPKHARPAIIHRAEYDGKRDTGMDDSREHLSDCQNMLYERSKRRRIGDFSNFGDSSNYVKVTADPCDALKDAQLGLLGKEGNALDLAGVGNASEHHINTVVDTQSVIGPIDQSLDDSNLSRDGTPDEPSSSSGSEWEFPDGKSIDSDWDSSLEDEDVASPQKSIPPIKNIPFGDFRHMVLQDRLRLLEETIKEHKAVLNGIQNRPLDA